MDLLYITRARESFSSGEYRKCLAFLANVNSWSNETVQLLVKSAYRYWTLSTQNKSVAEYERALELAHSSFSRLLDGTIPFNLILPQNYIMLTHIYLTEGNLEGALMITNLASARGHLEDIFIVFQAYLILKTMGNTTDVNRYFQFLTSKLVNISSLFRNTKQSCLLYSDDEDYSYLCAIYVYCSIQIGHSNQKDRASLLQSLCTAAYFLHVDKKIDDLRTLLNWISDCNLWFEFGMNLSRGPFVLLAAEFLWLCFCKYPLEISYIAAAYDCLSSTKRYDKIPIFLAKAYSVSPWNLFVRQKLYELSLSTSNETGSPWITLFEGQKESAIFIQRVFRGFVLRKNWRRFVKRLIMIRDAFVAKMTVSDELFEQHRSGLLKRLIVLWKQSVEAFKTKKLAAAIQLQSFMRSRRAMSSYDRKRKAIMQTNGLFLQLTIMQFERCRLRHFRKWYDNYFDIRRKNAASLIADVLMLNGYNQLLVKGMDILIAVLRVRRVHQTKRTLKYWHASYKAAQRRHATATIRFFLRACIQRAQEKVLELELFQLESQVAVRQSAEFKSNSLPLLRDMWRRWRAGFCDIINFRKRCRMVQSLQFIFKRRIAKQKLRSRLIRRECQASFVRQKRLSIFSTTFNFWRCLVSARIIQRSFRCFISRKIYRRKHIKNQRVQKYFHDKVSGRKRSVLKEWVLHVNAGKCETLVDKKKIRYLFRWWYHLHSVRRISLRKPKTFAGLHVIHQLVLQRFFTQFAACSLYAKRSAILSIMVSLFQKCQTQRYWNLFKFKIRLQKLFRYVLLKKDSTLAKKFGIFKVRPANALITANTPYAYAAFQTWSFLRKQSEVRRLEGALSLTENWWCAFRETLITRRKSLIKVQNFARLSICKRIVHDLIRRRRLMSEFCILKFHQNLQRVWKYWRHVFDRHYKARQAIQLFGFHSLKIIQQRRKFSKIEELRNNFAKVQSLTRYNKSSLRKAFDAYVVSFVEFFTLTKQLFVTTSNELCRNQHSSKYVKQFPKGRITAKNSPPCDFQSQSFHAGLDSINRTGCFIYDGQGNITINELSYCVRHSTTVFASKVDSAIFEAMINHFLGHKVVIHDCCSDSSIISFVIKLLQQNPKQGSDEKAALWPKFLNVTNSYDAIQLHIMNVAFKPMVFFKLSAQLADQNTFRSWVRSLQVVEFNTSSAGYLGTLKFFFAAHNITCLKNVQVWKDCKLSFPMLYKGFLKFSLSSSLEEFRFHGEMDKSSIIALTTGIEVGFCNMKTLELTAVSTNFEVNENLLYKAKYRAHFGKGVNVMFC